MEEKLAAAKLESVAAAGCGEREIQNQFVPRLDHPSAIQSPEAHRMTRPGRRDMRGSERRFLSLIHTGQYSQYYIMCRGAKIKKGNSGSLSLLLAFVHGDRIGIGWGWK